jgi:hypothetical protein
MSDNHPKISPADPSPAINSGSVKQKPGKKADANFEKILSDQIRTDPYRKNLQTVSSGPMSGLSEIEGVFHPQRLTPLPAESSQLTANLSDSIDLFDKYAAFLGDPDKSLKQTYGILEQVLAQVETLAAELEQPPGSETASFPDIKTDLKDILARLLTSARVEQIKFDRGDYL